MNYRTSNYIYLLRIVTLCCVRSFIYWPSVNLPTLLFNYSLIDLCLIFRSTGTKFLAGLGQSQVSKILGITNHQPR